MPARIFAPGEAVGYSNYNAILAGYIVSRIRLAILTHQCFEARDAY
jgi:hypothetical protein